MKEIVNSPDKAVIEPSAVKDENLLQSVFVSTRKGDNRCILVYERKGYIFRYADEAERENGFSGSCGHHKTIQGAIKSEFEADRMVFQCNNYAEAAKLLM